MNQPHEKQHCDSPARRVDGPTIQHRQTASPPTHDTARVNEFLSGSGFVLLSKISTHPVRRGGFHASAYAGPLDLRAAALVASGSGDSSMAALADLDLQLANVRERHKP